MERESLEKGAEWSAHVRSKLGQSAIHESERTNQGCIERIDSHKETLSPSQVYKLRILMQAMMFQTPELHKYVPSDIKFFLIVYADMLSKKRSAMLGIQRMVENILDGRPAQSQSGAGKPAKKQNPRAKTRVRTAR